MKKLHFNDKEFERILLYALKYAMGRRTYIVSLTADYIKSHLPYLTQTTVDCLDNYMKDYFVKVVQKQHSLGDPCDEKDWASLHKELLQIHNKTVKEKEVDFENRNTALIICSALRYGRNENDVCALQDAIRVTLPNLHLLGDNDLLLLCRDVSEPFYGTLIIGDDVILYQQILNELARRNLSLSSHYKLVGSWISPLIGVPLYVPFTINDEETKYVLADDGFQLYGDEHSFVTSKNLLFGILQKHYTVTICNDTVNADTEKAG